MLVPEVTRYQLLKDWGLVDKYGDVLINRYEENLTGKPHWHDCYEIEIVIRGEFEHIVNGASIFAGAGGASLLTPNDFHEVRMTPNSAVYNIKFHENIIEEDFRTFILAKNINQTFHADFSPEEMEYVTVMLEYALKEYRKQSVGNKEILYHTVNIIISLILRQNYEENAGSMDKSVQVVMKYMREHFKEPLSLVDVANVVNLNPSYFSVWFKKNAKISFKRYLNELRLNYARQQIIKTNRSIAEICFESGFEALSTFHREFKNTFDLSPVEFRKKNKK
ncbi:MAG: helix-turn-helix transcriptional regulator [Clostridia bacterium]|nr:helix-turn-helix transcriptional regulator [Clostridia bacterium]